MTYKRLTSKASGLLLFAGCWTVYFSLYVGRHNLSAVVPGMIKDGIVSEGIYGTICMCFFLAYGCGQLVNGILGDKISPFALVFTGAFTSGLLNIGMAALPSLLPNSYTAFALALCWGLNGWVQSMIWSPIIRIIAAVMPEGMKEKAGVNMSSSTVAGTLLAYLISSLSLSLLSWRGSFYIAGALLILSSVLWLIVARKTSNPSEHPMETASEVKTERKPVKLIPLLISSGAALVIFPVVLQGILNYGVTSWVPTILSTDFNLAPEYATLLTTVLPIINLIGAYSCHIADVKLFKNEMKTSVIFFSASALALVVMYFALDNSLLTAIAAFAVITSSMTAVNVLCMTFIPMYFSSFGRSSSVAGVLDSVAYIGCAISTYLIGRYIDKTQNWSATVLIWCGVAVFAVLLCLIAARKWGVFRKSIPDKYL